MMNGLEIKIEAIFKNCNLSEFIPVEKFKKLL